MNLLTRIGRPLAVLALTMAGACAITGCKYLKKDEAADAAVAEAVVEAADAGAVAVEAVADGGAAPTSTAKVWPKDPDQVPTPVDDEKMVSQLTKATYKSELDRVEKDVNGEK